jgi:hypothetical protein
MGLAPAAAGYEDVGSGTQWWFQFDALLMKNMWLVQARLATLLTVVLSPSGGVLLVELLRSEVPRGEDAAEAAAGPILAAIVPLVSIVHMQIMAGEKHLGLTGAMRMAGLSEGAHWTSYVVLFLLTSASGALCAALCSLASRLSTFRDTNLGIIWLTFFICLFAMSIYGALYSAFVARPVMVNLVSFFLFTVVALSSLFVGLGTSEQNPFLDNVYASDASLFSQLLVGACPWLSFIRVWQVIRHRLDNEPPDSSGFGFGDLTAAGNDGSPSALFSLLMMLAPIPVYLLLGWYGSQVWGGEMRQSWRFPCMPSYWGCGSSQRTVALGDTVEKERLLSEREQSIRLLKLSKSCECPAS